MELTEVVLKDGDVVEFTPMTKDYGRAEFTVCFVIKSGKLKEVFIYPAQQPDAKHYYHITINYRCLDWGVTSYTEHDPNIWLMFWCKEHKCQSFRMYVPRDATKFRVQLLSSARVVFEK